MIEIEQVTTTLINHGYEYKRTLGKGSFSSVILCNSRKYGQNFAIKIVRKTDMAKYEFNTTISLFHKNIIKIYDNFEDELFQYFIMEYCSKGTLEQQGKLSDDKFILYAKQILKAVSYCHSQGIAHRDIKPENIFLNEYDQIKLADFGLAKKFDDQKSAERCGTLMFFSPEMIQSKPICPFKADIWALGITLFYMATGCYPYQSSSKDELKKMIYFGQLDFDDFDFNQNIRFLIAKMTVKNPNLRLSPDELLQSPLFVEDRNLNINIKQSFKLSKNNKENCKLNLNSFRIIENRPKTQRNIHHFHHLTF